MQTNRSDILKVALLQSSLEWEAIELNLAHFQRLFSGLDPTTRLVVLPEMFATGFTMNPSKFTDEQLNRVFSWMQQESDKHQIIMAGSSIAPTQGGYHNRFMVAWPNGETAFYNKRHLFRMGEEQRHYLPGSERVIVDLDGWRACLMVCYDLRFPVWSRNRNDFDLLIYVANWPSARQEVWLTLLKARAIENQCYVIGVNRIGEDPHTSYTGGSIVFSPKGEMLCGLSGNLPGIVSTSLNWGQLEYFRERFPVWKDADKFDFLD
jgi:predicted amidohydrolase